MPRLTHGNTVISQCSMRHLYARKKQPGMNKVIDFAKTLERRRCGHHPDEYPEPLGTMECLAACVDPKSRRQNKHNYVVASQDVEVRRHMRQIPGVPLLYINRSVLIMEPMADATQEFREWDERAKIKAEIKKEKGKSKRKHDSDSENGEDGATKDRGGPARRKKTKYVKKQSKQPSVNRSKKKAQTSEGRRWKERTKIPADAS